MKKLRNIYRTSANKAFFGLFWTYRMTLGPLLLSFGCQCRFTPSCSHYAESAIQTHGIWSGFWMSTWRILRCHPFARGGVDPVPQKDLMEKFYG